CACQRKRTSQDREQPSSAACTCRHDCPPDEFLIIRCSLLHPRTHLPSPASGGGDKAASMRAIARIERRGVRIPAALLAHETHKVVQVRLPERVFLACPPASPPPHPARD